MKRIDLTGQRFGCLVVVGEASKVFGDGHLRYTLLCECGVTVVKSSNRLRDNFKSCGIVGHASRTQKCRYCGTPPVARGLCRKHYQRWRNHGSPMWRPPVELMTMPSGKKCEKCRNDMPRIRMPSGEWSRPNRFCSPVCRNRARSNRDVVCRICGDPHLRGGYCGHHYSLRLQLIPDELMTLFTLVRDLKKEMARCKP